MKRLGPKGPNSRLSEIEEELAELQKKLDQKPAKAPSRKPKLLRAIFSGKG